MSPPRFSCCSVSVFWSGFGAKHAFTTLPYSSKSCSAPTGQGRGTYSGGGRGAGCVPKLLLQNSELCAFGVWTVCSEDVMEGNHWAGEPPSNTLSLLSSLCRHASVLIQQNLPCVKKASLAAAASCTVSLSTLFLSAQLPSWCVLMFSSHVAQLIYSHRCSCESLLFILSSWYKLLPF